MCISDHHDIFFICGTKGQKMNILEIIGRFCLSINIRKALNNHPDVHVYMSNSLDTCNVAGLQLPDQTGW